MSLSQAEQKCVSMFTHCQGSISKRNTILPIIKTLRVPPAAGAQLKRAWHNILLTRILSAINLPGEGENSDEKSSTVEKKALRKYANVRNQITALKPLHGDLNSF